MAPRKRKAAAAAAEPATEQATKFKKVMDESAAEFLCPITQELPIDPVTAEDGRVYERSAIEEIIRWTTPIHHFRRTATKDTEIGGQTIREEDRVVVWYSSANRDEAVFPAPDTFDVTRQPNEHLAFGFGRHFCLGASLARLEMRMVFDALLTRNVQVQLAGPVDYMRSNFTNSLKRMPVLLRTAP